MVLFLVYFVVMRDIIGIRFNSSEIFTYTLARIFMLLSQGWVRPFPLSLFPDSDLDLIFGAKVIRRGKKSLTLSWKQRYIASNILNTTTAATWLSDHGKTSASGPEFRSDDKVGFLTGIAPGDAGTVCLRTEVLDTDGELTYILTYIKDIMLGTFLIFLSTFTKWVAFVKSDADTFFYY